MTKTKIIAILTVIILLLVGSVLGVVGYISNGFKDWSKFVPAENTPGIIQPDIPEPEKPDEPEEPEKQLVSTTIVSADYGTFEMPANAYLLNAINTGIMYPNKTNFQSIIEENKTLIELVGAWGFNKDDVSFGLMKLPGCYNSASYYGATEVSLENNATIYKLNSGETLNIPDCPDFVYEETMYMSLCPVLYNRETAFSFVSNIYCKSFDLGVYNDSLINQTMMCSGAIVSDTGYILSEINYKRIMQDSRTKVTYNYA